MSAPSVPIISAVTAGDKSLTVEFIQQSNGGIAISKYQYSLNGGAFTDAVGTTSPLTISGLTNGTSYTVSIRAFNGQTSGASDTTVALTPYASLASTTEFTVSTSMSYPSTVQLTATNAGGETSDPSTSVSAKFAPSAPVITNVTPSNQTLTVAYTQANDGNDTITKYSYSLNGAAYVDISATSPLVIGGLTNGTSYTVAIKATNSVGTSPASNTYPATAPYNAPTAPVITDVSAGLQSVSVSFTQGSTGGFPVTSYKYSTDGTNYTTASGTTSPLVITGLTAGTQYTLYLKAVTSVAESAASNQSAQFTPYTYPSAPSSVSLSASVDKLTVSFTQTSNGFASIKYYKYSLDGGNTYVTTAFTSSPFDITSGITPGSSYSVKLIANNNVDSSASSASNSVTAFTTPTAPSSVSLVAGYKKITVSFTAENNGGIPIQYYKYSIDGGSTYVSTAYTSSPFDISLNIVPGTAYSVKLIANNTVDSAASTASNSVVPYTNPSAPLVTSLIGGYEKLTVKFLQDSSGYSPITGYKYSLDGGNTYVSTAYTSSPFDISAGVVVGTTYSVKLIASHYVDSSASAASNNAVPYSKPSAPTITRAVYDGSNLTITFTAPTNTGGVPISKYSYAINNGSFVDYYKP
jgi:hypothetical protein